MNELEDIKASKDLFFAGWESYEGFTRSSYSFPIESREVIPFETITSSGIKNQGDPILAYYASKEMALDKLSKEITQYLRDRTGRYILWRQRPCAYEVPLYSLGVWQGEGDAPRPELIKRYLWYATCRLATSIRMPK